LKRKGGERRGLLTDREVNVPLGRVEKDIEKGNFHNLIWVRVGFIFFFFFMRVMCVEAKNLYV
jgi:hypothetical protein